MEEGRIDHQHDICYVDATARTRKGILSRPGAQNPSKSRHGNSTMDILVWSELLEANSKSWKGQSRRYEQSEISKVRFLMAKKLLLIGRAVLKGFVQYRCTLAASERKGRGKRAGPRARGSLWRIGFHVLASPLSGLERAH